jgi:hypothetical protein
MLLSIPASYVSLTPYRRIDWIRDSGESKKLVYFATESVLYPGSEVACRRNIGISGIADIAGHSVSL